MKILHVNDTDLSGRRFNGHDMQIELNRRGIRAKQVVAHKYDNDPNTILLSKDSEEPFLRGFCKSHEQSVSLQSLIFPYGWRLLKSKAFKTADIVHYHLIHNDFISLAMFPELVKAKPSLLTLHDPWFFTGHCIYPHSCVKWKTGCNECNNLDYPFSMTHDRASLMWSVKKEIFNQINIDIIVASDYMLDMVTNSPIMCGMKNIHKIPFGVNSEFFSDSISRDALRKKYEIPSTDFVMFFRQTASAFKGLDYISKMLDLLKPTRPVTLLTCENKGLLSKHEDKFRIVETGKIYSNTQMCELYKVCDIFLMPSTAEAFGLMAIEAMASARPVVVTDSTSLPSVTFAPECGVTVPQGNPIVFANIIERLIQSPEECKSRGAIGQQLATEHYRFDDYIDKHIKLYSEILAR